MENVHGSGVRFFFGGEGCVIRSQIIVVVGSPGESFRQSSLHPVAFHTATHEEEEFTVVDRRADAS